jgi:hypothetical protein
MKKKVIAITITLMVATAGALTLVQCDHSNMARVTIHIQNDLYAQKSESIIDKLLSIISTDAYASNWESFHDLGKITLTISGNDMGTIEANIPPTSATFSTEVPAGSQRTIRLIYDNEGNYGAVNKTYGAEKTLSLTPGDNEVSVMMLPITEISSASRIDFDIQVSWEWVSLTGKTITYNIYRSLSENGTYIKANETPETLTNYLDESGFTVGETYYYRVSVLTDGVEGLLCEPYEVVF